MDRVNKKDEETTNDDKMMRYLNYEQMAVLIYLGSLVIL